MRGLTILLFVLALLLLIGYFFVTMIASFYAITEGWGLSILAYYAGICCVSLFVPIAIRLKSKPENYSNSLNILSIVFSFIIILLLMKSMVGVNQEIELYNTIKNFTNYKD